MTKHWFVTALLCTGIVVACGGGTGGSGSGVSPGVRLNTLSSGDLDKFCNYLVALTPKRTIMCSATVSVSVGQTKAECLTQGMDFATMNPTCTTTVGQAEDCFEALDAFSDAQLCSDTTPLPAACGPIFNDPACNN